MLRGLKNISISAAFGAIIGVIIMLPAVILASQNSLYNPTSGTLSGLSMVQGFNNAIDSLNTGNSGASAPSNQLSGVPSLGNTWINTTTNPYPVQKYDGSSWLAPYWLDTVNHYTIVKIGGGAASVASASTTDVCTGIPQAYVTITGTTTINSLGSGCNNGHAKFLYFSGALTLTQSSALNLPNSGSNITTAAGDTAVAVSNGSGNWTIISYQRASGSALSTAGLNIGASALGASALAVMGLPVNSMLDPSIASNQLTLTVLGVNGSALSSSNPMLVSYRSQTPANVSNAVVLGTITSAPSFTLGTADSMGCTTGVSCRLWIVAICQTESSGVCTSNLIGAFVASTAAAGACYPLPENILQSTGAGTAGGTTIGTIQTSVASLSGKAIRTLGYVEATWTNGTGWTALSTVYNMSAGSKHPCDAVQVSGGASITPTNVLNLVLVTATGGWEPQTTGNQTVSLKRGSTTIFSYAAAAVGSTSYMSIGATYLDAPASTSSQTYSISVGGGIGSSLSYTETEIMGALEPVNDNDPLAALYAKAA